MEILSRTEEIILLAIYKLNDNAYGITVREKVQEFMDKQFSVGAIYVPLERLSEKGFLSSLESDPTSERGGRRKRFYKLTSKGLKALKDIKELNEKIWSGIVLN